MITIWIQFFFHAFVMKVAMQFSSFKSLQNIISPKVDNVFVLLKGLHISKFGQEDNI